MYDTLIDTSFAFFKTSKPPTTLSTAHTTSLASTADNAATSRVTAKNHAITVGADDAWSTTIPNAHAAIMQRTAPINQIGLKLSSKSRNNWDKSIGELGLITLDEH
jgi:hypothetical protein